MNWSAEPVALAPPAVVTVTSTVPADSAGDVAVIEVVELYVTAVAVMVPNITVAEEVKPVPMMVTEVPPAVLPLVGVMDVTVGLGGAGAW